MRQENPKQSIPSLLGDRDHQTLVLHQPDEATFRAQANKAQPFKMTGLLDDFPLYQGLKAHETPHQQCDYLASLAPKKNIYYSIIPPHYQSYFGHHDDGSVNFSHFKDSTTFSSFCRLLKDHLDNPHLGTVYHHNVQIKTLNLYMSRLQILNNSDKSSSRLHPNCWIGHSQKVHLHNDPNRNMIGMFGGIKKVTLFPPNLPIHYMYPTLLEYRLGFSTSQVNPYDPDLEKYPLFKYALNASMIFYIHPGEVLYIPPLWWHACESDCFNVGFNHCFYCNQQHAKAIERLLTSIGDLRRNLDPATCIAERDRLYHALLKGITCIENNQPINLALKPSNRSTKAIQGLVNGFQDLYHCNPPHLAEYQAYKTFICDMLRTFELTNTNQPYNAFPDVTYHQMRTNVIKKLPRRPSLLMKIKRKLNTIFSRLFSRRIL